MRSKNNLLQTNIRYGGEDHDREIFINSFMNELVSTQIKNVLLLKLVNQVREEEIVVRNATYFFLMVGILY